MLGELNEKRRREKERIGRQTPSFVAASNEPSAHLAVNLIKVHSVHNTTLGELKRKRIGRQTEEGKRCVLQCCSVNDGADPSLDNKDAPSLLLVLQERLFELVLNFKD
jgi:hypothetical protein